MKAVSIDQIGGPEVLRFAERPMPDRKSGRVLVAVEAAGVNFIDVYHRSGLYPMELPLVPGLEGAGAVVWAGEDSGFKEGDRVAWSDVIGSYAEFVSAEPERLVRIPPTVSTETAAAVMLQGLTAHYLATDTFPLHRGSSCLIHAGAGGVGLLLIQIAKLLGASVVTTIGARDKTDLVMAAGADHVVYYREVDFTAEVERLLGPRPFDVVYDGVGADTFRGSLSVLRPRATMVSFGSASGRIPPVDPLDLMRTGSIYLTRPTLFDYVATPQELQRRVEAIFEWIDEGRLSVAIGARYNLAAAGEAHRALESRVTTGKVLLLP